MSLFIPYHPGMKDLSPWLAQDEITTWLAWLRVGTEVPAALGRRLQAESGLSLQDFDVLIQLADVPDGSLRISALAEAVHWERSRLSHHVKRMETRGLVIRQEAAEDARGSVVSLTKAGQRALENALPAHMDAVREYFFGELSARELATLRHLSLKMLRQVRAADAPL